MDDTQWLTFRKYAKRVKTFRLNLQVPRQLQLEIISSLQHCRKDVLPLLPNVTELEWIELSWIAPKDLGISLFRYFASSAVTKVTLSLMRWQTYSSSELAILANFPLFFPSVTSFTIVVVCLWDYEPSREVGRMVTRWPKLRTLRTCAIAQPEMDQLFSRGTLESLYVDYHKSSPVYTGRVPDTVREFMLVADSPTLCTRYLDAVYASPTKFWMLISLKEQQVKADIEGTIHLLRRRLDTSRLLSLTIQRRSTGVGALIGRTLKLRQPLVSALVEFTALRELDLDTFCTAQMSDTDYACLAGSLTQLRSLKLGTANPSVIQPRLAASIGAVIMVLSHCKHLETLHIAFDGFISPPGTPDGKLVPSEALARQGWGVSNKLITKLCVGSSPIGDATVNGIASCLKSIMPSLVQIECKAGDEGWRSVQNILELR